MSTAGAPETHGPTPSPNPKRGFGLLRTAVAIGGIWLGLLAAGGVVLFKRCSAKDEQLRHDAVELSNRFMGCVTTEDAACITKLADARWSDSDRQSTLKLAGWIRTRLGKRSSAVLVDKSWRWR